MTDLAEFLLARIAEDEQGAREASAAALTPWEVADRGHLARLYRADSDDWMFEVDQERLTAPNPGDLLRHFERHDPTRVLAECEAKRRIVELHHRVASHGRSLCAACGSGEPYEYPVDWPCPTLRLLALPYRGHPDFPADVEDE